MLINVGLHSAPFGQLQGVIKDSRLQLGACILHLFAQLQGVIHIGEIFAALEIWACTLQPLVNYRG